MLVRATLLLLLFFSGQARLGGAEVSARTYAQRGMAQFRAGEIQSSIVNFEKASQLSPEAAPHLWQLGISYYYAEKYEKGRKLFESHQTVNPQDVENAIWHFLCLARAQNTNVAREHFIPITDDRRVPMKELHGLFAGKLTPADVFRACEAGEPQASELRERLFYAHLYLGLYYEAMKQPPASLAEIRKAAGEFSQPHYMGDVARVHLALRAKTLSPEPKANGAK